MNKNHLPISRPQLVVKSGGNSFVPAILTVVTLVGIGFWALTRNNEDPTETKAVIVVKSVKPAPIKIAKDKVKSLPTPPVEAPEIAETVPEPQVAPAPVLEVSKTPPDFFKDEALLPLLGIDATATPALARDEELIRKTVAEGEWDSYRGLLARSLKGAMVKANIANSRDGAKGVFKSPVFYQAFLRWQILNRHSSAIITRPDHQAGDLFAWLMTRNAPMEEMLLTIQSGDDLPKVIDVLHQAWYTDVDAAEKYFNLALACAVVFDKEMSVQHTLNNSKSESAASATTTPTESSVVDPYQRYRWYIDKNEGGKLAAPVDRMTASDLVWVVCAPVSTKELDWAVSKMRLRRGKWGNAYGMVEYLMERAVNGLNPYTEYTFAQILKEGGVCGDQSYFCVNTARANGIPAMTLAGETDLGGHAWAAVKTETDEWDTQIGRIGGVSNGQASNPQVGGTTSEQEVWLWNDRGQKSRSTTLEVWRNLWLADFYQAKGGDAALAEAAIQRAHKAGQSFPVTWQRIYDLYASKTHASKDPGAEDILDLWQGFVSGMRAEFRENPRMGALASKAEDEFIFPYVEENDARRGLARERRRMERDAGEQKDLIATSLKREADLIAKSGETDALVKISRLYDRALRDYGSSITGFKMMSEDYFGLMKGDEKLAPKAVRDIELAFKRVVETGSKDWFRANTETSIYKMICAYYRQVGNESRALLLEKRYERLLRSAERGAL